MRREGLASKVIEMVVIKEAEKAHSTFLQQWIFPTNIPFIY
jgi:hypothetical protein